MATSRAITALLLSLAVAFVAAVPLKVDPGIEEDIRLDTGELLVKYGYPVERHYTTTGDGYVLGLFRVPSSPKARARGTSNGHPVLVMHGLMSSSADWVIMGPDKGLAYLLADAGFDVWLGNARGTTYSRNHTSIDPDDNQFWQFSWHEIGYYDLPAMIDYILEQTGHSDLFYVGHSQGTTSFYVMASTRTDYNDKIRLMSSLAPIGYVSHMTSPIFQVISIFIDQLSVLTQLLGLGEFLSSSELITMAGEIMCSDGAFTQDICSNLMFLIGGFNEAEMNKTMIPVIMGHDPAGCSTKQLLHYGQEIKSGHFRQYDFGLLGNLERYGSLWPPNYDMTKITAKVALHYSNNDWCAALEDVEKLYKELPNCVGRFLVSQDTFNHIDFMWAIHAKELVYDKVISLMDRYLP